MEKTASRLSRFTHGKTAPHKPALSTECWMNPRGGVGTMRSDQPQLYWLSNGNNLAISSANWSVDWLQCCGQHWPGEAVNNRE
jgi:hypothetical protein